eukprot:scaffold8703_cov140-Isochrysis_galbana.AAC.2
MTMFRRTGSTLSPSAETAPSVGQFRARCAVWASDGDGPCPSEIRHTAAARHNTGAGHCGICPGSYLPEWQQPAALPTPGSPSLPLGPD